MNRPPESDLVILDACCLINLYGTGRAEDILSALPFRFAVARYVVEEEVLEVRPAPGVDDPADRGSLVDENRVALRPLLTEIIARGVVEQFDIATPREEHELVRFAIDLDDGEAHTCALAIVRNARVATDDKKAIRTFEAARESHGQAVEAVLRTSELVFRWAHAEQIPDQELADLLRTITSRASFLPPRDDPYFERWIGLLS